MSSTNKKNSNEEINLINISKTLNREKNLIFFIVLIATSLSTIYFSKVKPIFAGSFEIVISEQNKKSRSSANELLGLLTSQDDSLDSSTQKLILTSPFVLNPVLDYVNRYKTELTGRVINKKFKTWIRNNLIVDFEENSNVLKVTYMDKNKDLILNVLNLISKKYQDYSKSSTIKALEDKKVYLSDQKITLSKKLDISKKAYNKFTIDNGLGNIDGFISLGNSSGFSKTIALDDLDLENNLSEGELGNIENSASQLRERSNSKAGQRFEKQFALLEEYESDFVILSSKLKPNSKTLKNLKVKIDNLKESLKRPNEILIKYDELYKTYLRDEKLLNLVEDNLAFVKLEQVKNLNTWEIISPPFVRDKPVYPKQSEIFILFLISSSILAAFVALLKEKLSNLIFLIDDIEKQLNCDYIDSLSKKENGLSFNQILNAFNLNSNKDKKNFGIINYKNKVDIEFIKDFIETKEDIKVSDFTDFSFINKCEKIIILIDSGSYTSQEIEIINKYISFSKEKVIGWFFIEN